jgi:hypothetical protein
MRDSGTSTSLTPRKENKSLTRYVDGSCEVCRMITAFASVTAAWKWTFPTCSPDRSTRTFWPVCNTNPILLGCSLDDVVSSALFSDAGVQGDKQCVGVPRRDLNLIKVFGANRPGGTSAASSSGALPRSVRPLALAVVSLAPRPAPLVPGVRFA